MAMRGQQEGSCGDGTVLYLECINVHILIVILDYIVLHVVTIMGRLVKMYTESLCIIFFQWHVNL